MGAVHGRLWRLAEGGWLGRLRGMLQEGACWSNPRMRAWYCFVSWLWSAREGFDRSLHVMLGKGTPS